VGIMDHRKTWRFRVNGSPQACIDAFAQAFAEGGGILARGKWDIRRSGKGAVAIYGGRAGLIKGLTMMSATASAEESAAVGSEVTFEIEEAANGTSICAMWLSTRGSRLGFTADGRFFRPYMRAVENRLQQLDPRLSVSKA
jgi:hypothetical protein